MIPVKLQKNKNSDQVSGVGELIAIALGQLIALNYKGLLNKMLTWLEVLRMETLISGSKIYILI
jgi:hypothetical protein